MTHASLFSGIGGFDLAAEWIGWTNVFYCEIDHFCHQILAYHFPNVTSYEDITKTDFREWRGKIDVLTSGFPCQPFSIAGNRKGEKDDRYLWHEMLRAVREIRPAWVVGENVAGIVSMVQSRQTANVESYTDLFGENYEVETLEENYTLEAICRDLECAGYSVQPFIIPACAVGAPHRRDRVWIIAQNSERLRCNGGKSEEKPDFGKQREFGAGNNVRIQSKTGTFSNPSNTGVESLQEWKVCTNKSGSITANSVRKWKRKLPKLRQKKRTQRSNDKFAGKYTIPTWVNFPTQSPLCSRDDGISAKLDGIALSKWRRESIKAYGNAIVPQVAYEIFKAINEINNL